MQDSLIRRAHLQHVRFVRRDLADGLQHEQTMHESATIQCAKRHVVNAAQLNGCLCRVPRVLAALLEASWSGTQTIDLECGRQTYIP